MKYDWEKSVEAVRDEIEDLLPDGIVLIGVAVMNVERAEGAIAALADPHVARSPMVAADVGQDILGDADRFYDAARADLFKDIRRPIQ